MGSGMGGVCGSLAWEAFTRCRLWGRGRASQNTSRNNQRAWSGRSSRLRAPQHPPPPPSCTGPPHGEPVREHWAKPRGSRWAKLSSSGGRLGLLSWPEYRGGSSDFCPGTRRRLHSLKSLHRSPRSHEAPHSNKSRASRAVLPSPLPIATATKWRTREKQPGTSPLVQRIQSAHARSWALPPPPRRPFL